MQKCSKCRKDIDATLTAARIDGEFYQLCSDCKSILDKINRCNRCGNFFKNDLLSINSNGQKLNICPSCKPSYGSLSTCDKCKHVFTNRLERVNFEGSHINICPACFQDIAIAIELKEKQRQEVQEAELEQRQETQYKAANVLKLSELDSKDVDDTSMIDALEYNYRKALLAIDTDIPVLIAAGKEMAAILQFNKQLTNILDVLENLNILYSMIYNNLGILEEFESNRLREYGNELLATRHIANNLGDEKVVEQVVTAKLRDAGFEKKHWYIKPVVLSEIEYMLHALHILIEPDFTPLEEQEETSEDKTNRYVPAAVKRAVWRRDLGKCVECGSKVNLEYDHIIPVAKGGSNTERNIQLLCETCNRQKSAHIQ